MKNRLLFLPFLLLVILSQSSCINVIEEIFLNKNGSGKYVFTIDMNEIMKEENLSMLRALGGAGDSDSSSEEEKEPNEFDKLLSSTEPFEIDSTINFAKEMSAEEAKEYPDFMNRMNIRMQGSTSKEKLELTFNMDFENLDELNLVMETVGNGDPDNMDEDFKAAFFGKLKPTKEYYSYKGKQLTRNTYPAGFIDSFSGEESENLAMLKMVMASATYKSIIHLPGKAKGVDNEFSEISKDKKTVTTEIPMLDYWDGKNIMNSIKVK